jgi:hypothetical protein
MQICIPAYIPRKSVFYHTIYTNALNIQLISVVVRLVKKRTTIYGTRTFNTVLIRVCYQVLLVYKHQTRIY